MREIYRPLEETATAHRRMQDDVDLRLQDPSVGRFLRIVNRLEGKTFPTIEQPAGKPLSYGEDYFLGKNDGEAFTVKENARKAIFQGEVGVEPWRVIKTIAYRIFEKERESEVVMVHLRGDREVDENALAERLGIKKHQLYLADLESVGLTHGTASPLSQLKEGLTPTHIFDQDLVDGKDFPGDDLILTSSGDPRFYLALDIRRYIESMNGPNFDSPLVSMPSKDSERVFVSKKYEVISGDPTSHALSRLIQEYTTELLEEKGGNFGNRSGAEGVTTTNREIAWSIDVKKYYGQLKRFFAKKMRGFQDPGHEDTLVTTSSIAAERIAREEAEGVEGVEVLGREEAIKSTLANLREQGVVIDHTLLMGLPSVYDPNHSAFSEAFLEEMDPVSDEFKQTMQGIITTATNEDLVNRGRKGSIKGLDVYSAIEEELGRLAPDGDIDKLKGRTVVVILGISDIDELICGRHNRPKGNRTVDPIPPSSLDKVVDKFEKVIKADRESDNPEKYGSFLFPQTMH